MQRPETDAMVWSAHSELQECKALHTSNALDSTQLPARVQWHAHACNSLLCMQQLALCNKLPCMQGPALLQSLHGRPQRLHPCTRRRAAMFRNQAFNENKRN